MDELNVIFFPCSRQQDGSLHRVRRGDICSGIVLRQVCTCVASFILCRKFLKNNFRFGRRQAILFFSQMTLGSGILCTVVQDVVTFTVIWFVVGEVYYHPFPFSRLFRRALIDGISAGGEKRRIFKKNLIKIYQ